MKLDNPPNVIDNTMIADVLIGVPCQDECASFFAYDLARLTGFSAGHIPNCNLRILFSQGTLIGPQREDIVDVALDVGATHILWLDSDMRFPKETLQGLLAHDEAIVGANYCKRIPPHNPTAYFNGQFFWTYDDSTGLYTVDHVGMGVMLTKTEVFKKIGAPRFPIEYDSEGGKYIGEDVAFMRKAKLAGFEVKVDQDLSKVVQHTGKIEYTYIHGLDAKEHIMRVTEAAMQQAHKEE